MYFDDNFGIFFFLQSIVFIVHCFTRENLQENSALLSFSRIGHVGQKSLRET